MTAVLVSQAKSGETLTKGETAMSTQIAKFIARVAENLPDMKEDIVQGWIENPKALQKFLLGLCPNNSKLIIDCDADPFTDGDPGANLWLRCDLGCEAQ